MPIHAGNTRAQQQLDDNHSPPGTPPPSIVDIKAPSEDEKPRGGMFSSLRTRNYRLYASGQVISLIGVWMQRVAQDWLVLQLSDGSPVALGIAVAIQFAPTLALSLWAGVLADRLDKRKFLIVLQAAIGLCGLTLGVLDVTGVVQLWHVYLLCLVLGVFTAVETPVRQSFSVEMVGKAQVTNAVALNSMTFNIARILGPALAGLMINWVGTGWVFIVNGASFAGVITGLVLMNPAELFRSKPVPRGRGQLREGLRYVRGRADLVVIMVLAFGVSTFGLNFHSTLAVISRNEFHGDASLYGALSTAIAVGTLSGAIMAARRSSRGQPRQRLLIGGAAAFGVLEIITGFMPDPWTMGALLVLTGAAALTFTTVSNAIVQLSVAPEMRGRVMGLYMLVFLGGNPLGSPLMGWVAEHWGPRSPVFLGGAISLLFALVCGVVLMRRGGVELPVRRLVRLRVLTRK
ncbi:MFS transporter [Allokutzneria multivorans]|uniref:MFS transporter n=1 Tax=Allokutzneria multivorans TaxID=1142134 RepID=UPI003CD0BB3D